MRNKLCSFGVLAVLAFMAPSCDNGGSLIGKDLETDESTNGTPNISGTWKVKKISISGELKNVVPSDDASYSAITIKLPETTQGYISGNTFINTINIEFEIKEDRQIILKNYDGTRRAEDEWGWAFKSHIMSERSFIMNKLASSADVRHVQNNHTNITLRRITNDVQFMHSVYAQEPPSYVENELIIWLEQGVDAEEFTRNSSLKIAPKSVLSEGLNIWLFEFTDEVEQRCMFKVKKFDISKNNELIFMDSQNNSLIVLVKAASPQ